MNRQKGTTRTLLTLGILLTTCIAALFVYKSHFFILLDYRIFDTLLRSCHRPDNPPQPVIVDIDDNSLKQFGQWPWPRYRVAMLLEKLQQMGATAVGLDMVFAEPDRTSLANLKEEIKRDLGIDILCQDLSSTLPDNDRILADVLARGPFALGYQFAFDNAFPEVGDDQAHPVKVLHLTDSGVPTSSPSLIRAASVTGNLDEISSAAPASGFFNFAPDTDSIARRVPLLIEHKGKIYPSLALATLLQQMKADHLSLQTKATGEQILHLNRRKIPLDGHGRLLVNYRGPGNTFPYVSAADVLVDLLPEATFKGKIVFVGSSAIGLKEFRPTPLDPLFPGVEVHATVVDNILRSDFIQQPSWTKGLELLLILALGIGSTLLFIRFNSLLSLLAVAVCTVSIWEGAELAFRAHGTFISPLFPMMTLWTNFTALNLLKYRREEKKVRAREREISSAQEFTIQSLASLAETRDSETGSHIIRTQKYVKALCEFLAVQRKFQRQLTPEVIEVICKGTPLHDIGKVGISDSILLKPGALTEDEFEQMKKHTTYGRNVIISAQERLAGNDASGSDFLECVKDLIYTHHEWWDGSGYPQGLKGEEIPISGRLMALADVYDALTSKRVYKTAFPHDTAVRLIVEGRGKHFDPDIVDAFLQLEATFKQIAAEFSDHPA